MKKKVAFIARAVDFNDFACKSLMKDEAYDIIKARIMELNSLCRGTCSNREEPLKDSLRLLENYRNKLDPNVRNPEKFSADIYKNGVCHSYARLLSPYANSFPKTLCGD